MTGENRAGGCEWFPELGIRIQYARCWECMCGMCPGGPHDWACLEDIEHARTTGQTDPTGETCGCVCVDGPLLDAEPDWEDERNVSLDAYPCPVCGEFEACAYDSEGRPLIHVTEDEDAEDEDAHV